MNVNFNIEDLLELTQAEAVVVLHEDGRLITSVNIKENTGVASASAVLFEYSNKVSAMLTNGDVKQVILKSTKGILVGVRLAGGYIVVALTKELTKSGLVMMAMDKLDKKRIFF